MSIVSKFVKDKEEQNKKIQLPLWRNPDWKLADGTDDPFAKDYEEYFGSQGKLYGMIEPFGNIWLVSIVPEIGSEKQNIKYIQYHHFGYFLTKELGKKALEVYCEIWFMDLK